MQDRLWPRRTALMTAAGATLASALGRLPVRAASAAQYTLMVWSEPVAGREDEYNEWYNKQHLPDVVSVPGFVRARRLKLAPVQFDQGPALPRYLAYFEISTDDFPGVMADVTRRIQSGAIMMSSAFNNPTSVKRSYRLLDDAVLPAGGVPLTDAVDAADGYHIEFSAPVPGQEDAYEFWYDLHRLPDVLAIPGFESAQRGASTRITGQNAEPPGLAIYRFDPTGIDALAKRLAEGQEHMHKTAAVGDNSGYTFLPLGPVLDGFEVRAQRAAKKS